MLTHITLVLYSSNKDITANGRKKKNNKKNAKNKTKTERPKCKWYLRECVKSFMAICSTQLLQWKIAEQKLNDLR